MNIKHLFPVALAVFVLFGCATPAELRQQGPLLELRSAKSSKAVAICISDKWEGMGAFGGALPVSMRLTNTGFVVSLLINGQTGMLVDIDEAGAGSTTKYYKGLVLLEGSFVDVIKGCQ